MVRYVYNLTGAGNDEYVLEEHAIYESRRVGIDNHKELIWAQIPPAPSNANFNTRNLGLKSYELAKHLGNLPVCASQSGVLVTVSNPDKHREVYKSASGYSLNSRFEGYPLGDNKYYKQANQGEQYTNASTMFTVRNTYGNFAAIGFSGMNEMRKQGFVHRTVPKFLRLPPAPEFLSLQPKGLQIHSNLGLVNVRL